MDYIDICITVINVLFYIYNDICVHCSVNKSYQYACTAEAESSDTRECAGYLVWCNYIFSSYGKR
jgi:hypothetical protein